MVVVSERRRIRGGVEACDRKDETLVPGARRQLHAQHG